MWDTDPLPKLFAFLAIFCFPFTGSAQKFDAGLTGGITGSQISGDNLAGFNKFGFTAGAFSAVRLHKSWDMHIEMNYIQKGSRKNFDPEDPVLPFYFLKLNYVEIPVIFRFYQKRFLFEAGIGYGRLISFKEEDVSGALPYSIPFYKSEITGQLGIGTRISPKIHMVWRYSNSLLPVRPHSGGATWRFNRGQYISVLEFMFQYRFREREANP